MAKAKTRSAPPPADRELGTAAIRRRLIGMAKTIADRRGVTIADVFDAVAEGPMLVEWRKVVAEVDAEFQKAGA